VTALVEFASAWAYDFAEIGLGPADSDRLLQLKPTLKPKEFGESDWPSGTTGQFAQRLAYFRMNQWVAHGLHFDQCEANPSFCEEGLSYRVMHARLEESDAKSRSCCTERH